MSSFSPASPVEPPPRFSVCIVTGRRPVALDACLASLTAQDSPPPFEVLVCSDGDAEVVAVVHARFPTATVAEVGRSLPGAARNVLLQRARGDVLLFLDDDVTVRTDLLTRLDDLVRTHPEAVVFGGPNETPPHSSRFQIVQGAVLASMVGSGPVRRRYGQHPGGPADERFFILCNLAVRRSEMPLFLPDQVCAEENAVLSELHDRGLEMHYDPELVVFHERRGDWRGFAAQMRKYGLGRGQLIARRPSSLRIPFLMPSLLVVYLAIFPVLTTLALLAGGPRTPEWLVAAAVPLVLYAGALAAGAARVAATLHRPARAPLAAKLIATLHLAYGWGLLRGVATRFPHATTPEPRWMPSPGRGAPPAPDEAQGVVAGAEGTR